jgi:hypothetical protein
MNRILLQSGAALAVLLLVGPADAQSSTKPMLQVTAKSTKELLTKAKGLTKTVMEAAGQDAMWPMVEGMLANAVGNEGEKLPGLDTTKPIGFRAMYKPPKPGTPIDGDVLLLLPVKDSSKLIDQGLPMIGLANPTRDGELTTFQVGGAIKGFAREANGYLYITVVDAGVVAANRLPPAAEVVGDGKHDLSISISPSAFPESSIRQFFDWAKTMQPAGSPPTSEHSIQQIVDTDSIAYHFDLDPSGKVVVEMMQSAKAGTKMESVLKKSAPGPLKSVVGLAPDAIFSGGMRGDWVAYSQMIPNMVQQMKAAPNAANDLPFKTILGLVEELAKSDLEDLSLSVSKDGTAIIAVAVGSTAAFELKIGETVDALGAEVAKNAGDQADKVKERTKKNAVTVAGVPLSRIWVPIPKGKPAEAANIYLGVKDNVAFVAMAFSDSTSTIEAALKRSAVEEFDPVSANLKLKGLAEAFEVDYKGSAEAKIESKGGHPFRWTMEFPVKDVAELFKGGLAEKLKERFEP